MRKASISSIALLIIILILAVYSNLKPVSSTPQDTIIAEKEARQAKSKVLESSSSDATIEFRLTSVQEPEEQSTHTLEVIHPNTNETRTIHEWIEPSEIVYSTIGNSWSPDNKEFLLIKSSPISLSYLIFRADGKSYKNDQKYLDVSDLWTKSGISLDIKTITGWAGDGLSIVLTSKRDEIVGPKYWFVTSTQKFLILSN